VWLKKLKCFAPNKSNIAIKVIRCKERGSMEQESKKEVWNKKKGSMQQVRSKELGSKQEQGLRL
jgi:hypothetical protein